MARASMDVVKSFAAFPLPVTWTLDELGSFKLALISNLQLKTRLPFGLRLFSLFPTVTVRTASNPKQSNLCQSQVVACTARNSTRTKPTSPSPAPGGANALTSTQSAQPYEETPDTDKTLRCTRPQHLSPAHRFSLLPPLFMPAFGTTILDT